MDTNPFTNDTVFNEIYGPVLLSDKPGNIGHVLICLPLDALFFGIMLAQIARFAQNWADEDFKVKVPVVLVALGATLNTAWLWFWMWEANVAHYGEPVHYALTIYIWPIVMFAEVVTFVIQVFFTRKAWLLWNRHWGIVVAPAILCLAQLAGTSGAIYYFSRKHNIIDNSAEAKPSHNITYVYIFAAIGCDLCITGLILWKLIRSRTGWSATDSMIRRLVLTSIEGQVPPTVGAAAVAVQMLINPFSSILSLPWILLSGKVYALCFYFSLNSREFMKNGKGTSQARSSEVNTFKSRVQVDVERITQIHSVLPEPDRRRHAGLRVDEETGPDIEMDPYPEDRKQSAVNFEDREGLDEVDSLHKNEGLPSGASASSLTTLVRHETKAGGGSGTWHRF